MVRTLFTTAVLRRRNLTKTKAAPPKSKRKAASPKSKSKRAAAQLKKAAAAAAAQKMMEAAAEAVDVQKMLSLSNAASKAMETECFPLTATELALAGEEQSAAEEEKVDVVPEKKKKTKIVKVLVPQGYINHIKEAGLFHFLDDIPEEELAKKSQLFQHVYRAHVLITEKIQAYQKALLDQYDAFGYAYDVKEVTDDEAEDDGEGVLVVNN